MTRIAAPLLLALVAAATGCKRFGTTSDVQSAFTGTDCKSLYDNYTKELQPRLKPAADKYVASFQAYKAAKSAAPGTTSPAEQTAQAPTDDTSVLTDSSTQTSVALRLDDAAAPDVTDTLPRSLGLPDAGIPDDVQNDALFAVSNQRCMDLYLPEKGKGVADQVYNDCRDFFTILDNMNRTLTSYNANPLCREGGYQRNINPELYAFCDAPCTFSSQVNCTKCTVSYTTPGAVNLSSPVVCLTAAGVNDVGSAFCRKMADHGYTNCGVSECSTDVGSTFRGDDGNAPRPSGSSNEVYSLALTATAGVSATASIEAGVVASGTVSVTGNLVGTISVMDANDSEDIMTTSGVCRANSSFTCKANFTGFVVAGANGEAGVGGSFKVFGNGASAKAVVTAGANINIQATFEKTSGAIPCNGIGKELMGQQCLAYVKNVLAGQASESSGIMRQVNEQIAGQIKARVDDMANKSAADLAFQAQQAQQARDAGSSAGRTGGDQSYKAANARSYNPFRWTACYKYDSGWGMSGEGQEECDTRTDAYSGDKGAFRSACYARVAELCRG